MSASAVVLQTMSSMRKSAGGREERSRVSSTLEALAYLNPGFVEFVPNMRVE